MNPETLYHYCDVSGFKGILESKCVWLSHAYFMNDYMEHQWLINKANDYILSLEDADKPDYVQMLREPLPRNMVPFLSCLSSDGDVLSQWRAYADEGAGFVVGFSRERLVAILKRVEGHEADIHLDEVEYDATKQQQTMESHIALSLKWVKARNPKEELLRIESLKTKANIWRYACCCKNSAFREEQEWRVVFVPRMGRSKAEERLVYKGPIQPVHFRTNQKKELVPYFELEFPLDTITEIRLGPKNPAREDDQAISLFLASENYDLDRITIRCSEATYR